MMESVSRRDLLAAAVFAPILPGALNAQSTGTLLIEGRTFSGARSLTGTGGEGGEGFRAKSGMLVRNCHFLNLGNGAIRVNVPTDNLVIEDCDGDNLYRFLEDTSSVTANPAVLSNFALRRIVARELDRGMTRIRYGSHHGTIEDVVASGSAQGDLYCVGFQLDDQAHDITYQRVEAHGFRETNRPNTSYWNGDGFSDERGNRAIRYLSCTATDCTDGGFDLKSADMFLENCVSRGNKRNYRLWSKGKLSSCHSEDPKWRGGTGGAAHFSFHGAAGRFVIDRPIVRAGADNAAPVFLIETSIPLTLDIINADIDAPAAPLLAIRGPAPQINWSPAREQQTIRVARDLA
ncbi:hypothetical protein [Allosphingosinicella sp.]|uniref:hypothetical protein n=1 Tax=Allosphingosinicella sp. TaxID=2823234 RepID=UPI002FC212BD